MTTYFYTYRITLLKGAHTGHYYLGKHITCNLEDGYAGSGKIVKRYYNKYGKVENKTYTKEIIAFYDSDVALNKAEHELISDLWKTDDKCLNLVPGGGYLEKTVENISKAKKDKKISEEVRHKISVGTKRGMNNPETRRKCSENAKKTRNFLGHHHSEEFCKQNSERKKGNKYRLGIGFTEEAKKKISDSVKEFYRTHKRQYNADGSYKYILKEANE